MLNNSDSLEKVSFLGFACVFWDKNYHGNSVATRQCDHEKKKSYLILKPTRINILIVISSSLTKKRQNWGPWGGLLRTNSSTFLIVFWLTYERVWLVQWWGSSMVQHMIKNMIGSCWLMVICKLGQMSDMKNISFLSYLYPFLRIQFRFCGPRANLRSVYEVAKTIPTDFSPLAPTVWMK